MVPTSSLPRTTKNIRHLHSDCCVDMVLVRMWISRGVSRGRLRRWTSDDFGRCSNSCSCCKWADVTSAVDTIVHPNDVVSSRRRGMSKSADVADWALGGDDAFCVGVPPADDRYRRNRNASSHRRRRHRQDAPTPTATSDVSRRCLRMHDTMRGKTTSSRISRAPRHKTHLDPGTGPSIRARRKVNRQAQVADRVTRLMSHTGMSTCYVTESLHLFVLYRPGGGGGGQDPCVVQTGNAFSDPMDGAGPDSVASVERMRSVSTAIRPNQNNRPVMLGAVYTRKSDRALAAQDGAHGQRIQKTAVPPIILAR